MDKTYYTVYKVTNTTNNKFYIGKHQTTNLDDGYMGSGKFLKRAIKKYGIESFLKEVLYVFDNEADMNAKEKELVVVGEGSYNLCEGGVGGFSYINSKPRSQKHKQSLRKSAKQLYVDGFVHPMLGKHPTEETLQRLSVSRKQLYANGFVNPMTGKLHTEEALAKISRSNKGKIPWNKGILAQHAVKEKIRQGVLKANGP